MRAGCRSGALSVRARHTPPGCRTRVRGVGCVYLVEPGWHRGGCCATRLRCAVRGVGFLRTSYGHHTDIIRTSYGQESRHIRPRKRQGSDKEADIIRTSYGHHTDIIRTSYGQGTGHNRTRSNHPPLAALRGGPWPRRGEGSISDFRSRRSVARRRDPLRKFTKNRYRIWGRRARRWWGGRWRVRRVLR